MLQFRFLSGLAVSDGHHATDRWLYAQDACHGGKRDQVVLLQNMGDCIKVLEMNMSAFALIVGRPELAEMRLIRRARQA